MSEILKRAITGGLYILLLLAVVFLENEAFDFLFLCFGLVCLYEFKRLVKIRGWYVFILFMILWGIFVYFIKDPNLYLYLLIPCLITNVLLTILLFRHKYVFYSDFGKYLVALLYIGGGFVFLAKLPYSGGEFAKMLIIGIFILIWANDTFAYLIGRAVGKHKLMERISPKKTVEGFIGGLFFALIAAILLGTFSEPLRTHHWLPLSVVVVLAGSIGDLIESKFKRSANVKDSGAILPGHGGLYDRLDSLIFASPFIYLTLQFFSDVP